MLTNTITLVLVAIAIGTISVTYSNPVPTVSQDNNDLATEASPSVTIQDPESDTTEKVTAEEETDAPMSPSAEGAEQLSTMASPAENSDNVEASQSEASETSAPLSPSDEPSAMSTAVYTNPSEQ